MSAKRKRTERELEGGAVSDHILDSIWRTFRNHDDHHSILNDNKKSEKAEIDALIAKWNSKRQNVYGISTYDKSHVCVNSVCSKSIELISKEYNLFGCIKSGKTHQCFRDDQCKITMTSKDCETVCIFSNVAIGQVTAFLYQKADTNKEDYNVGSDGEGNDNNDYADGEDEDGGEDGGDDDDVADGGGGTVEKEDAIIDKDVDNATPAKVDTLILALDDIDDDLKEDDHLMLPKQRRKMARSLVSKKKHRGIFDPANLQSLRDQAKVIITDLLFNASSRQMITKQRELENEANAAYKVKSYYKKCKKKQIRPNLLKADDVYEHGLNLKRLYSVLPYDDERAREYVNTVVSLWLVMLETSYCEERSSKFHFKQHVIACLYLMSEDYFLNTPEGRLHIFHKDPFLEENMFLEPDLKDVKCTLSITQSGAATYVNPNITDGRNNIKTSLISMDYKKIRDLLQKHNLIK
jgi:hypothetical protein